MSEAVAQDMLRSYFERWQRLEEEKQQISDDLKALFAEAKGYSFDTKAMRVVFREQVGDRAEREEFDSVCDLYRNALTGLRAHPAHSAHGNVEKFDAETGEIFEPAPTIFSSHGAETAGGLSNPLATGPVFQSQPLTSSPGGATTGEAIPTASPVTNPQSGTTGSAVTFPASPTGVDTAMAALAADESAAFNSQSVAPLTTDKPEPAETGLSHAGPGSLSDKDVPAFLHNDRPRFVLRPHCQHPDDLEKCAGVGKKHCHACELAAASEQVEAA